MPLTADYRHDVKAMSAADAIAGVFCVVRSQQSNRHHDALTAEIEWLVDNKPAGSIVVIDEAYIHFSATIPTTPAIWRRRRKDVLINRTFSKIFGMAGLRVGW